MSTRKNRRLPLPIAVIVYIVSVAVIVGLIIGNLYANKYSDLISVYFNQKTYQIQNSGDTSDSEYFKSSFSTDEEREAYLKKIGQQISAEGATLLKNDNGLPLAKSARVSVFGQDSVDPIYGGGGAGSIDLTKSVSLEAGLKNARLTLNPTLSDFYTNGAGKEYRKKTPDVYGQGSFEVNEVPVSAYTQQVKDSFSQYADAAIVVIGRSGGESSDISTTADAQGNTYLQLTKDEKDTLSLATSEFDKVIVLLNTSTPIESGFLNDYPIQAALWIGSLGQEGSNAVGKLLTGASNPSGSLVDTYAYDSKSAPSIENFGSYSISNSQVENGNTYMVYGEGIYVGYLYYETRYEDVVLGNDSSSSYDYTKTVQFPFGYGESYTEFKWSDYTVDEQDDNFKVSVNVENSGDAAGKDTVQIYMQQPYTAYDQSNGIEKPSVQLVGYSKTKNLKAGESQTVTVTVPKELMKSYDSQGKQTYIVDSGDYYLTAGHNAHDAVNNVLAAKGKTTADGMDANGNASFTSKYTQNEQDDSTYSKSLATGNAISNQFTNADISTYDSTFKYLSRQDWEGTWPTVSANGKWNAPQEFLKALEISSDDEASSSSSESTSSQSDANDTLTVAALRDEDFDSSLWDTLMNQASIEDLDELVRMGGYATKELESIGLPATTDKDGPAGISDTLVGGASGQGYAPAIVLASTWNDQLSEDFGNAIGEDSLALGVTGWYAPSMNIHRSPYSGRNFEYYSEDAFLSGGIGAATVKGAQEKGVLPFVKHFALNDQETNRIGISIFANEQSIRQVYLAPFETAVRDGKALGMMASMNRIGALWSGADAGLMTSTLRDEWGFQGAVVTDQASFAVFAYEDRAQGLAAGTDLWLNTDASLWKFDESNLSEARQQNIRRAAKNIAFAISRSNAMNGLTSDGKIVRVTPPWRMLTYAGTALVALIVLAGAGYTTLKLIKQRKEQPQQTQAAAQ